LAFSLLAVSIVSGFAWDIRISEIMYHVTGGLLNRGLAADLHTFILIPMILALTLHMVPSIKRFAGRIHPRQTQIQK